MPPLPGDLYLPGTEDCAALDALCLEPAQSASGRLQEEVLGRKLSVEGLELTELSAWHCQPCIPTLVLTLLSWALGLWLVWN